MNNKAYQKTWYKKNKKTHIKNVNARRTQRRQELKRFLEAYKTINPCIDCGRYYPSYVYDFDHRVPKKKNNIVSYIAHYGTIEQLIDEIILCDLICANCHRLRTFSKFTSRL